MNPELPNALLGKKPETPAGRPITNPPSSSLGDGLNTDMPLPSDAEVINMSNLPKEEFFGLIANAGLATTKNKCQDH